MRAAACGFREGKYRDSPLVALPMSVKAGTLVAILANRLAATECEMLATGFRCLKLCLPEIVGWTGQEHRLIGVSMRHTSRPLLFVDLLQSAIKDNQLPAPINVCSR